MVAVIIFTKRDFGPMLKSMELAEKSNILFNEEKYGLPAGNIESEKQRRKNKTS